eukprot:sb/3476338/
MVPLDCVSGAAPPTVKGGLEHNKQGDVGLQSHPFYCIPPTAPCSYYLREIVSKAGETKLQEPTDTSKQPIRTRYLGHVTGYQPISDQYFLHKPLLFRWRTPLEWKRPRLQYRFLLVGL